MKQINYYVLLVMFVFLSLNGAAAVDESNEANNSAHEPSISPISIENDQTYNTISSSDNSSDHTGYLIAAPAGDVLAENSAGSDKGRDSFKTFTLPDRKIIVQAGDIRLQLTKTDVKKEQYNIKVTVDGRTIEKKNQKINEPLQFTVENNHLSYEVFINWVRRNSAGGYLRIKNSDLKEVGTDNETKTLREQYNANTSSNQQEARNNFKAQTTNRQTSSKVAGGSRITIYRDGDDALVPIEYDSNTGIATIAEEYNTSFVAHSLEFAGWIVRARQPSGLFFTRRNEKWGIDDVRGNEVVPPTFERVTSYTNSLILVCLEGKWGIIDSAGDEIVPAIYERIEPLGNGFSIVRQGGAGDDWMIMNAEGVIISTIESASNDFEIDLNFIRYWYTNYRERELPESVVLSHWSEVKPILPLHAQLKIVDVYTGITYYVASFSNGNHADVETITAHDTALFFESRKVRFGGRPVWVTIGGTTYAAALYDEVHGGSTIPDNDMDGQICLHFLGSTNHNRTNDEAQRTWVLQAYRVFELLNQLKQYR